MRNDAPVIILAEWAARVNAETRAFMGVVVGPELPEYTPPPDHKFHRARREARTYLAGLMDDDELAAAADSDLARVCPDAEDDGDPWNAPSWREAAVDYHKKRGGRVSIIDVGGPNGAARSTLKTAEYLVRQRDPERLRQWIQRHSPQEIEAILQHLERRKGKP